MRRLYRLLRGDMDYCLKRGNEAQKEGDDSLAAIRYSRANQLDEALCRVFNTIVNC